MTRSPAPRLATLTLCLLLLALASACGIRPARPDVPITPARPLSGEYTATIHTTFVGPIRARMIAEPTPDGFKANTPPGAAWVLIGGLEKVLGPLFAPYLFPSGMLVTWQSTLPTDSNPGDGTIGVGSISAFRAATSMPTPDGPIEIRWKDNRLIALLTLAPTNPSNHFADYPALALAARDALPRYYFDPALARSRAVASYLDDLQSGAAASSDDLEFLFTAAFAARKHIARHGTPLLYPLPTPDADRLFQGKAKPPKPFRVSADSLSGISVLRIDAFVDDATTDAAITEALATSPRALILDLRTCPGIELTAFRAASSFFTSPVEAGAFFGPTDRDLWLRDDVSSATTLEFSTDSGGDEATTRLLTLGAARIRVQPKPDAYAGPLAVLTSRRTSSTAEALATLLVRSGRARSFGEPTAGRPLLSREVELGQGWAMRIAAFDYRPATGQRIGPKGEPPSTRCPREDALNLATEWLTAELAEVSGSGAPSPPTPR